jgi:uncharacterized membrane protein YdjX (TVP38/TMEM64 family)
MVIRECCRSRAHSKSGSLTAGARKEEAAEPKAEKQEERRNHRATAADETQDECIDRLLTRYLPIGFVSLVIIACVAITWYGWRRAFAQIFEAVDARKEEKVAQALIINVCLLAWVVLCIPGPLFFVILDGFFFGWWKGFILAFCAEGLGALLSLAIARSCCKTRVHGYLMRNNVASEAIAILEEDSTGRFLVLFRFLSMPVWLKNYSLAILTISVLKFFLVFIPAETFYAGVFTYIGSKAYAAADELRKGSMSAVYDQFTGLEIALVLVSVVIFFVILFLGYKEYKDRHANVNERTALLRDQTA